MPFCWTEGWGDHSPWVDSSLQGKHIFIPNLEWPFRWALKCMPLDCGKKPDMDTGCRRCKLYTEPWPPAALNLEPSWDDSANHYKDIFKKNTIMFLFGFSTLPNPWLECVVFLQFPGIIVPVSRDPTGEEGDAGWGQQPHWWPADGIFSFYNNITTVISAS